MGMKVNAVISIFYFCLFLTVILVQALSSSPDEQIAIEVLFIKNWYMMQTPWRPSLKTHFTIFDFSMIILSVILLIHCLMNLYIAKESALIYADEVYKKSISQLLDLKRQGVDGTNFLKSETTKQDEKAPAPVDQN